MKWCERHDGSGDQHTGQPEAAESMPPGNLEVVHAGQHVEGKGIESSRAQGVRGLDRVSSRHKPPICQTRFRPYNRTSRPGRMPGASVF